MEELYITGVGKSGLVARLIAATYSSVGKKMQFIDTIQALHGDLGYVGDSGYFYFISKSGKTEEIWKLIDYLIIHKPQVTPVLITFEYLKEREYVYQVVLPKATELDPHDIVPSYSLIEVQKYFYRILGNHCSKNPDYIKAFKLNHPGGSIGKSWNHNTGGG